MQAAVPTHVHQPSSASRTPSALGRPLRVLYCERNANNPSKTLRILEPLRRLEDAGLAVLTPWRSLFQREASRARLDTSALRGHDLLFLHVSDMNANVAPLLAPLVRAARERGVSVVCDADDPYVFPSDNGWFEPSIEPHLESMRALYREADLVTVTTEALRAELLPHAQRIEVLPNTIDFDATPRRRDANSRVRVGWCGGPSHTSDLAMFAPALRLLQERVDFEFVLFGMFDANCEGSLARARALSAEERRSNDKLVRFGELADAMEGVRFTHHPSVPYHLFGARLAELDFDIGVCPLVDTRFNRCRSAVKFYQYAAAGTVCVTSDTGAYRGECDVVAANDPQAWAEALEPLVRSAELRAQRLASQRAFVSAHRDWKSGLHRYRAVFTEATLGTARERSA